MTWPGWEGFTEPDHRHPANAVSAKTPRRTKYNAVQTTVEGLTFDSRREAARFQELRLEQHAGAIAELELQPQFPLHVTRPDGTKVVIGRYIADFKYRRHGQIVIEDAKGYGGKDLYVWKKKHVESQYGVVIVEV